MSRHAIMSAVAAVCSVAALAACSSSSSSSSSPSSSSPSSSSPRSSSSSSPSPSSSSSSSSAPSAAAQKFLGLTAGIDSDLQGFLALPNSTSAARAKAAAAKLAKAEGALVSSLKKNTWPASARPDITNLERTSTAEQAVYAKCARSSSVSAIKSVLAADKATIAARVAAATHVRTALGLPNPAASSSTPA